MKTKIRILISLSFLLFLFNLSIAQAQTSGELKKITIAKSESALGVQIELDKPLKYESFPLINPNRLVIDFPGVEKFSCDPLMEVNDFGVITIRVAKYKPDVTRIVFILADKRPSYTFKENERTLNVIFLLDEVKEKKPPEVKEKPVVRKVRKEEPEKKEIEEPSEKKPSRLFEEMTVSVSADCGFYAMHSADFQETYGKSILFFGGETTVMASPGKNNYIGASLGFKYISDSGISHSDERVELRIIPISLTALYLRQLRMLSPFVGVGLDYYDYKETFPEASDIPTISSYPWGTHIQVGAYIKLAASLSLKLFFKYTNARAKEGGMDINLGGNEYGLALSYHFKI